MSKSSSNSGVVNQFLPSLWFGDAISNHALAIRAVLRTAGYQSDIYAENMHTRLTGEAHPYTEYKGQSERIAIYHHSIGSPVADFVRALPDKRLMIYHNITPSHFFEGYNDEAVRTTRLGRQQLTMLLPGTHLAVGDSPYNEQELKRYGYSTTDVLPIFVDFRGLDVTPNQTLMKQYDSGINIIFVGRLTPHKAQHDVIRAFALFQSTYAPDARLFLIGSWGSQRYRQELTRLIESLGVRRVYFASDVSMEDLATYYKCATLFVSMSEHEGFLVPLVEAMHVQVPILAYAAAAVPDTLGTGGLLVEEKNFEIIAALMHRLVTDTALRARLQKNAVRECERFDSARNAQRLLSFVKTVQLLPAHTSP